MIRFLVIVVFLIGGRLITRNMDLSNDDRYRIGFLVGAIITAFMVIEL